MIEHLASQGEAVAWTTGYTLDDPALVAVLAGLQPQRDGDLQTSIILAFSVRVTDDGHGNWHAELAGESR